MPPKEQQLKLNMKKFWHFIVGNVLWDAIKEIINLI